jgi:hypothetical protein
VTAPWKEVAEMTTEPPAAASHDSFNLHVAFYRRGAAVIEATGVARRKTAGLLARIVRALAKPGAVLVIDLSELAVADYWLVSAVAKAHAAAQATRADLRLVVGCRPIHELLHSSGLDRLIPVTECRDYNDLPGLPTQAGPDRVADRQRIIDLSAHGAGERGRGLAAGRARWTGPSAIR